MKIPSALALALGCCVALHAPLRASSVCEEQLALRRPAFQAQYRWEQMRAIGAKVTAHMSAAEKEELPRLSARFNAIAHDSPEHVDERIALQGRARQIVRAAAVRAGYVLMRHPSQLDPFDAMIGVVNSSDGYAEYTIEVRALLVFANPYPHVSLWFNRWDPAHNPHRIVSLGIMPEAEDDYVDWKDADFNQYRGSPERFLKSVIPECRPAFATAALSLAEAIRGRFQ
ncbi:MAG: hypothetical protein HY403_09720 [Elusimicrobia bacterium]|nr:hypothetical protein [Elusimicrobiota bacterium]